MRCRPMTGWRLGAESQGPLRSGQCRNRHGWHKAPENLSAALRVQAIAIDGRLCLKLREAQDSGRIMPDVVRIPITNIYAGGPYTGRIFVGAKNKPMNVFLDTGSSTLVLSRHSYCP